MTLRIEKEEEGLTFFKGERFEDFFSVLEESGSYIIGPAFAQLLEEKFKTRGLVDAINNCKSNTTSNLKVGDNLFEVYDEAYEPKWEFIVGKRE